MAYINSFLVVQVDPPNATTQTFRMVLEFTGNAGETTVRREYQAGRTSTAQELRRWAYGVVEDLNDKRTVYNTTVAAVGQTLSTLAPSVSPPTAKEVWWDKARRYQQMQAIGVTAATADLATLKADIEATYDPSYL